MLFVLVMQWNSQFLNSFATSSDFVELYFCWYFTFKWFYVYAYDNLFPLFSSLTQTFHAVDALYAFFSIELFLVHALIASFFYHINGHFADFTLFGVNKKFLVVTICSRDLLDGF